MSPPLPIIENKTIQNGAPSPRLKLLLDSLHANRSQNHLENDPFSRSRSFIGTEDQEIAALIASSFAYGNVKSILGSLDGSLR